MSHLFIRSLNFPGLILIAVLGVAIQTSLFTYYPFIYLKPDIILILVIWMALKREFIEGGALTLIFANIAEIHSTAPQGLFLSTYMIVYLMIRSYNRMFMLNPLTSLIGFTMFTSIIWKLSGLAILFLLGVGENQWRHTLVLLLPGAVMQGVLSIWVYRWLDRYDWITYKDPRARQTLADEVLLDDEGL